MPLSFLRAPSLHGLALPFVMFALALLGPEDALARDIPVDGPAALETVLAEAQGGDRLLLAPGTYGKLGLNGKRIDFASTVTITSADPDDRAVFSELSIYKAANITLDGILFDYTFAPGDKRNHRPFALVGAQNVTIRNSVFDGDEAYGLEPQLNGNGYAYGLSVRSSRDIAIEDNLIRTFKRGFLFSGVSDLAVTGNEVTDMSGDGMNFAQVQHVRIEDNYIHDFRRDDASRIHPDMIQFWTAGKSKPNVDILIRGNLLSSGQGPYTQSIFMRNEEVDRKRAGKEMFYRDLVIADNLIINAHLHGITVGETKGLTIRNNTLVRNPGSDGPKNNKNLYTPMIRASSKSEDVMIVDNVMFRLEGFDDQSGWIVRNNYLVQDRTRLKPGFYGMVFEGGDPLDPASFRPKPGGPLDGTGIGAPAFPRP